MDISSSARAVREPILGDIHEQTDDALGVARSLARRARAIASATLGSKPSPDRATAGIPEPNSFLVTELSKLRELRVIHDEIAEEFDRLERALSIASDLPAPAQAHR